MMGSPTDSGRVASPNRLSSTTEPARAVSALAGFDPARIERRRQFLIDWFSGEATTFADRNGAWTVVDFLNEMVWQDVDALRALIRARFAVKGQPSQFAAGCGLCDETMLSFLRGARDPADDLLSCLGWERKTFYRHVDPCPCYNCTRALVRRDPHPEARSPLHNRLSRMFLCETCGNKRCPHGADHNLSCTASNEPGQRGSRYEDAPTLRDSDGPRMAETNEDSARGEAGPARAEGIAQPSPSPPSESL